MDLKTFSDLATIAAPLTKTVFDTFITPKIAGLKEKWKREDCILDHAFESKFQDYLLESYEKLSFLSTVAFRKRKVLLKDVFVPLTIQSEGHEKQFTRLTLSDYNEKIFNNSNKILITDTAGMGKSTLSKKLFLSCIDNNAGVPILIELRRLSENKRIIDEILEQLNPINEKVDRQFILDLIKRGDFIFFLDGFDEISISERSRVTSDIQKFVSKARKNKFILTSRPEEALSSFGDFFKFQINPLKTEEAFQLIRKYDANNKIADLLIAKIQEKENFENIKEYLNTPLLVSLLFTAFEHKQRIPFKKHIFYRQVYDALFESHDLSKGDSFERDKFSKLGSDEFHRLMRSFGFLCLKEENQIEFNRDALHEIVQRAIDLCGNLSVKPNELVKDLLITVPLFIKDGIYYKWSHKSLQEYFAAQFIYLDSKEKQSDLLKHISFHRDNTTFYNVIDLYYSIDPLGFEQIVKYQFIKDYLEYVENSYQNFKGGEKLIRQEYSFLYEIYLIRFKFDDKRSKDGYQESPARKMFQILQSHFDQPKYKRMSIQLRFGDETELSHIKVPRIPRPENTLINFFKEKGEDFIVEKNTPPLKEKVHLNLKYDKPYKVTDRKNSILNKEENFDKTNRIIETFLGSHRYVVNIEEGRKELKRIQQIKDQKMKERV